MTEQNEKGFRVVVGDRVQGLVYLSQAAPTAQEALEYYGSPSALGQGVVRSNTLQGALNLAKMCKFYI